MSLFYLCLLAFIFISCETNDSDTSLYLSKEEVRYFEVEVDYFGMKLNDWGVLMLPAGYNLNASNTDLVLYCHSGGGSVSKNSSECERMEYNKYLVSQGFAVLSMASMPVDYARYLMIDQFRTVGSEISLLCSIVGYNYVMDNYSFSGRVFLLSNSNGGLLASNLVHFSDIPFTAQCGIAPLLSIELNAWFIQSGAMSGGRFNRYQNRDNIISLYGMSSVSNLEDLSSKYYEKEKVGEYDPFDYYMSNANIDYPCPYLIFSCVDDKVVLDKIAREFSDEMQRRSCNVQIDTTTSYGAHNVCANPIISGKFKYKDQSFDLNEVFIKICNYFTCFRD